MTIHRVHSVHSLLSVGRSFGFADRVEKMHIPDLLQEKRMFKTLFQGGVRLWTGCLKAIDVQQTPNMESKRHSLSKSGRTTRLARVYKSYMRIIPSSRPSIPVFFYAIHATPRSKYSSKTPHPLPRMLHHQVPAFIDSSLPVPLELKIAIIPNPT